MALNIKIKNLDAQNIIGGNGSSKNPNISDNQFIFSNGNFAADGDAQTSLFLVRGYSTGTEQAELYLDGVSSKLVLRNNTSYFFTVRLLGRASNGNSVAMTVDGAAKRGVNASTVRLIGKPHNRIIYDEIGVGDMQFDVSIANGALRFYAVGKTGTNIRWLGRVELSELSF